MAERAADLGVAILGIAAFTGGVGGSSAADRPH
jgi:hypothetical protein